jgi:hypothetical protein
MTQPIPSLHRRLSRRLIAAGLLVALAGALAMAGAPAQADEAPAAPAQSTAPVLLSMADVGPALGTADETARQCCKICRKGKACGDSCINRAYTCHRPPGCACNGN